MTPASSPAPRFDDEIALADRCARREPEAIRELLTANNQRLFRAAWSILKDRDEAEEAVQSAYMSAFAAIRDFTGRSTLSTWLTRIAINEALGRLRDRHRRDARLAAQGVTILDNYRETLMTGSVAESPDSELARKQIRTLVECAVGELPDQFRSVFVLRDVEGMSIEETAEALEIPMATVKSRLHRARSRLQEILAPEVHRSLVGAFPFAGIDCERMTQRILSALSLQGSTERHEQ